MTHLRLSYVNIEHGGRTTTGYSAYSGDGGPYDYDRVTGMLHDGDWPDILVIGEGDRYELNGMEGAYEAAAALRDAGGPAYVPHPCSLPREWGMFAPVIYVNPQKVVVRRFYSHRLPDFASRNRNLLLFTLPGRTDPIRIAATHGDIYSGDTRLADNRRFDRLADPAIPCALLGDWNTVPSGPHFEPTDMNKPGLHNPRAINYRVQWKGGPEQAGPHVYDTRALDALCGWWNPATQQREGGIGFHHVADMAKDYTPTQIERPNGHQCLAIDGILLNDPLADAYVPGSYHVHDFRDPEHPDSDHKRISVTVDI
ncbi:endonuclease/exonuclease/phosphatase family protein [Actinomadura latina]|uniref:Endonuclease/exonuclease/phosphatase family protein n=1 Tax=Actinomadura latina TaxID=163603 RepID=A0A846YX50_9ACTN|nr:endonuclease/exonuclease/phosphatase family protein [Actinomadura latina]NKZ03292.1 endonuclease/exonuclease/phosphatase family protein [Actinomadura latina]